jgi:hypothetical protein
MPPPLDAPQQASNCIVLFNNGEPYTSYLRIKVYFRLEGYIFRPFTFLFMMDNRRSGSRKFTDNRFKVLSNKLINMLNLLSILNHRLTCVN